MTLLLISTQICSWPA